MSGRSDDRSLQQPSRPVTSARADISAADVARLRACLAGDGVAVIPTDTVYGLACNPDSETALRRIYELKRRPPVKPAAVMFFSLASALASLPELGPLTRTAFEALLPGPVTLLLANPEKRFQAACEPAGRGAGLLGLRVPSLAGPLSPLATIDLPAAQSSANLSGGPDPRRLREVPAELRDRADQVLDGGELAGIASTVVNLSGYERDGHWQLVREGPLDGAMLKRLLG